MCGGCSGLFSHFNMKSRAHGSYDGMDAGSRAMMMTFIAILCRRGNFDEHCPHRSDSVKYHQAELPICTRAFPGANRHQGRCSCFRGATVLRRQLSIRWAGGGAVQLYSSLCMGWNMTGSAAVGDMRRNRGVGVEERWFSRGWGEVKGEGGSAGSCSCS